MKRVIRTAVCGVLCAVMLLMTTACGSKQKEFSHGKCSGTVYTSEWLGLKADLGSGWELTADAQLASLNKTADMSDSSLISAMEDKTKAMVTEMVAVNEEDGSTINIIVQNIETTNGIKSIDEDVYFMGLESQLKNYGVKETSVSFCGKNTRAVSVTIAGVYETQVPVFMGKYIASITFAALDRSSLASMINKFSSI